MTLIALTVNHGYPVMMGDILISHPEGSDVMPIPTFTDGNRHVFSKRQDMKPFGLNQKLYVINDRLCIALAGKVTKMETFLKQVKLIYSEAATLNIKDLFDFIDKFCDEEGRGMDVIALTSTSTGGDEHSFSVHARGDFLSTKSPYYEEVVAAGSGARQFIDFIRTNPQYSTDLKGEEALLYMNQSLIAYWLGQEVSRGESLSNLWGAGYEMIIFKNGSFVKLDEYTVVLLTGEFGTGVKYEPAPFLTMLISYQNDLLIIRVILHDREKTFYVPSIIEGRTSIEIIEHEAKHEVLMIIYILTDVDTNTEYTPCIIRPRNVNEWDKSPVVFKSVNGKIVMGTDKRSDAAMLERVIRSIGVKK